MRKNEEIIDKLGGKEYLAELLNITKGAVYSWFYPKPKGSAGKIPAARAIQIYELAKERGIDCTLKDVIGE